MEETFYLHKILKQIRYTKTDKRKRNHNRVCSTFDFVMKKKTKKKKTRE